MEAKSWMAAQTPQPLDHATEVEIQRRVNELKSQFLDEREKDMVARNELKNKHVEHKSNIITMYLAGITVLAGLIGFIGFKTIELEARGSVQKIKSDVERNFRQFEDKAQISLKKLGKMAFDAQENAKEAKRFVADAKKSLEEIKKYEKGAELFLQEAGMNRKEIERNSKDVKRFLEDTQKYQEIFRVIARRTIQSAKIIKENNTDAMRQNIETYKNLGDAKAALKKYKDAISNFNKAIGVLVKFKKAYPKVYEKLKKDFAKVYKDRGNAKAALKNYKGAIDDYDKAIDLKADFASAYYDRGKANATLKQKDKAKNNFNKALELARKDGNKLLISSAERALRNLSPPRQPRESKPQFWGFRDKSGRIRLSPTPYSRRSFLRK